MLLDRFRQALLVLAIAAVMGARAEAQQNMGEGLVDRFNAFFPIDPSRHMTVSELCCRLDCIAEELRDDGLVLIKSPDVFSQARLTRFRNDYDIQMSSDLANFHLVLAARINRLDSATTTSATALGAALSAPGTTNVTAPTGSASTSAAASLLSPSSGLFPSYTQPNLFGGSAPGAFGNLGVGPNTLNLPAPSAANAAALTLGVEPTVYLEEKARFLNELNHLRRLNLGPDQNDSSGYGLYLVRLPVSIAPGECTFQGHGADLSVQVQHEFTPDFLPSAFRRLVINDIVDQLGPHLYEAIRSGYYEKVLEPRHEARNKVASLKMVIAEIIADRIKDFKASQSEDYASKLSAFILRSSLAWNGKPGDILAGKLVIQYRRDTLAKYARNQPPIEHVSPIGTDIRPDPNGEARPLLRTDDELRKCVRDEIKQIIDKDRSFLEFRKLLQDLYEDALPDDVKILDDLLCVAPQQRALTNEMAGATEILKETVTSNLLNANLASSRTDRQTYPIKPRELRNFFGEDNLAMLAQEVLEASRSPKEKIRSNEIRDYLRHLLDGAYDWMARPTDEARAMGSAPPLADDTFMTILHAAIQKRNFESSTETLAGRTGAGAPSELEELRDQLMARLEESRHNIQSKPFGALCWAVAVDAALLDGMLKRDARKILEDNGEPVEPVDMAHFYRPADYCDEVTRDVFCRYVQKRWPIITFSLDPVTDQQNIADSFSLNRDLQLAASFAFATGQINFSQLNSFRRQIQQSADTIALNRTITGFMQSNDIFGYRFTPRFQNPPNQRTNFGVIASQLISGGPGPDYSTRKAKLEPGVRELNAVLLIPTFLPAMRMNVSTNWFKLTDPEHLVHHTGKMMERGRKVQELRDAVQILCNAHQYRDADLRVLQSKMTQLDSMLPMQSRVVQLPFENSAAGFDLFIEGSAALTPELTGFSGVDIVTIPSSTTASSTGGSAGSGSSNSAATSTTSSNTTSPATFSITNLASPNQTAATTTYTISGGTTAIADVFVFGKYISLLDTRVIAGGRVASFEILSREVIHVQIPSNVSVTTTEDKKTYVEVYVATPNGISNSLLIPCQTTPTTPTKVAYDLDPKNTSVNLYYQWLPGPDGKAVLAASSDASKNSITITWDSDTGVAPRQIQAQFVATINSQNVVVEMPAAASTTGDYTIDGTLFTAKLLDRLHSIVAYPSAAQTPINFTINVLPWTPADPQGLRAITKPKTLPTKLTVNLLYNAVGPLPLPATKPANSGAAGTNPPDGGGAAGTNPPDGSGSTSRLMTPAALDGLRLGSARGSQDPAVVRSAQGLSLPSVPSLPTLPAAPSQSLSAFLQAPQPPPRLASPALLAPNVATEAEQIAKATTGQSITTTVSGSGQVGLAVTPPTVTSPVPTVVVNPAPVTVIAPPAATDAKRKKHTSAVHRMLNRFGNRVSSAATPD
jgi:hypothetical protein